MWSTAPKKEPAKESKPKADPPAQEEKPKPIYKRRGKYYFTGEELNEMKGRIVTNLGEVRKLTAKVDEHKATIKNLNTTTDALYVENESLAYDVNNGFDYRPLNCTRVKDYDNNVIRYYSVDTGELVCEETMTLEDRQTRIDD